MGSEQIRATRTSAWCHKQTSVNPRAQRRGASLHTRRCPCRFPRMHKPWQRGLRWLDGQSRRYICRSTIIRLISAMALAGLRPFGQALAQFMMVWQR